MFSWKLEQNQEDISLSADYSILDLIFFFGVYETVFDLLKGLKMAGQRRESSKWSDCKSR